MTRLAERSTVVIPTVKAGGPLEGALQALGPVWRARCVVIDNGAPAAAIGRVRDAFAEVQIISLPENGGFAKAVNLGIGVAGERASDAVVLVNDDVEAGPEALDALVGALLEAPRAGSAAGTLLHGSTGTVDTAGLRCDPGLATIDVGRGLAQEQLAGEPGPIGASGGFAAYRIDALRAVGHFDEGFFAYYEDLDLALRLRSGGWACVPASQAVGRHLGSATLGWRSVEKAVIVGRSRGRIARKYGVHRRPRAWPWLAAELAAGFVLALETRSPAPASARIRGFASTRRAQPYPDGAVEAPSFARFVRARLGRRYGRGAAAAT